MIQAFVACATVPAGEELVLHVSTDEPSFRVAYYRLGARREYVGATGELPGAWSPHHLAHHDWSRDNVGPRGEELPAWPAYVFTVPEEWRPGVYVAVLDGSSSLDARSARAVFVVRSSRSSVPCPVLYKLPLLTYHAYNQVGPTGRCLYSAPTGAPPGVSVRRPGGGSGGVPWDLDNFDPFDPTPRQTVVHWDEPFIEWMEREGYRADYCTDLDLHRDPALLDGRRLLVSAGHDEYWSDAMRAAVARFVASGGNAAFFSGNTCWWRVEFDDEWSFRRVANWGDGGSAPENELTGVSFRNGGERDRDDHPDPVGFTVQHADHWVFDGTGLGDGDRFGHRRDEYIVGYECDGAHYDRGARGAIRPTGDDGTPPEFVILGIGDLEEATWGTGNRAATMGLWSRGGTVFTAATTDWARLLRQREPAVMRITANVLSALHK